MSENTSCIIHNSRITAGPRSPARKPASGNLDALFPIVVVAEFRGIRRARRETVRIDRVRGQRIGNVYRR